ncbi:unnamed protein product [Danaus chrysippus]|uniref:(African queen) hypothetical protein n=1 Tax=Danaus chrysippus TaxID=151541 RepID=A0A8J2QG97_9NEOP|nr:unnamed protein product [Danaus chrysippus]
MGHVAQSMASGGHPEGAALVTRHDQLAGSLARLQRLAASRQAALMESVQEIEERCRAAGGVGAADRLALLPERR